MALDLRRVRIGDTIVCGEQAPRFLVRIVEKRSRYWWHAVERWEDEPAEASRRMGYDPGYLKRMGTELRRPS